MPAAGVIRSFTYNCTAIMKLSYNSAFAAGGFLAFCYNRASFFGQAAISLWFLKIIIRNQAG